MFRNTKSRRGVTLIETIVSFSLLITVLSVTAPLMVRNTRLLADARAYRCATDELSDQLDALIAVPPEEQPAALEAIASETLRAPLSDARISGSIDEIDTGRRITLTLAWPMAD
ncbi:MAG: type II secretion system protein, partial [Planctomycetota bacterium]